MSEYRVAGTRRAPADPPNHASHPSGRSILLRLQGAVIAVILLSVAIAYTASAEVRAHAAHAISHFVDLIAIDWTDEGPLHADLMFEASELFYNGRWIEAQRIYERLIRSRPDDPKAWYGLALCRHHFGDYEAAINANRRAMADPLLASRALYNLATEYALTGRHDRALESLDGAFRLGFLDVERAREEPAFHAIRYDRRFSIPSKPDVRDFTADDGTTIEYTLVLPRDFDPSRTYPALLALPGSRQDTEAMNHTLESYWGMQASYHGWIVVSPKANTRAGFAYGDDHGRLPELLDHIQRRFSIEGDRFHLAGYSNGGTACFRLAVEAPERFHSITTLPCYEISDENLARLHVLEDTPVTLFYGELDDGPSPATSRRIDERLRELGLDSTLTVLDGEPHMIISLMGDRFMTHMDTLRLRRRPEPLETKNVGPYRRFP